MIEIVFDTETTGFDPFSGDRLVEIGCVEVENFIPTGKLYHQYINPERDMPAAAEAVHGLSAAYLRDFPTFAEVCADFMDFVGDKKLVAHNAEFDMRFINYEIKKLGFKAYPDSRAIDTLAMARKKFPGSPNTLDALCKRFHIDNGARVKHGALLDAELLAEVYLELKGGRQRGLSLVDDVAGSEALKLARAFKEPRSHHASSEEKERHAAFVAGLNEASWLK
jgi:DNA polymerase-3 subunit epsilon